jgi:glycosyltransferase involved in cell wall biosynthesis
MMDYRKAYGLPERYFLSLGRMVEKKNLSTLIEAYARFARASGERSKSETGNLKLELSEAADGGDPHAGGQAAAATKTEHCKLNTEHCAPALVFVGSGELEGALREQARGLGLRVVDCTAWKAGEIQDQETKSLKDEETEGPQSQAEPRLCETGLSQNCKLQTENSVENDRGAVYFYGFRQIEENPVFYALAEAFVLPSLKEEWGLVVNEAMAAGLPVIVSRTAGCAEDLLPEEPASRSSQLAVGSIHSGENADADDCQLKTENSLEERSNGFVFDPSSVDALSDALRRIAEGETADGGDAAATLKAEMGRRSREIVAKFGCENFAKQAMRAAEAAQQA